jgi:hypothetical protein
MARKTRTSKIAKPRRKRAKRSLFARLKFW